MSLDQSLVHLLNNIRCEKDAQLMEIEFRNQFSRARSLTGYGSTELKNRYGYSLKTVNFLQALPSLSRLLLRENYGIRPKLDSFEKQAGYARSLLYDRNNEYFFAILLDAGNCCLDNVLISAGSANEAAVYPSEILKAAIESGATNILLAHNHPSGICDPSVSDLRTTGIVAEALADIGVTLSDHIIIGKENAYGIRSGTMLLFSSSKHYI